MAASQVVLYFDKQEDALLFTLAASSMISDDGPTRANEALVAFLSDLLKTPKSAVRIQSGEHGRNKRVEIRGITRQQILDLLREEA